MTGHPLLFASLAAWATLNVACIAAAQDVARERLRPTDGDALREASFTAGRLAARRRALLAALPDGAVVVVATRVPASDLTSYRPNPDFLYLSGQRDPGLSLFLSAGEDVLFAPPQSARYERWNGPRLAVDTDAAAASGFRTVALEKERADLLAAAVARGAPLYVTGITAAELGLGKGTKLKSPRTQIAALRQVKDAAEIALLARAVDITCASLLEAMASIRPGQYEYEIQAVIEYMFTRYGAQRPGFFSIVGSGPNTCVLHYSANRRRTRPGDLVVMDVGAELWGYTADVTRTVPVSGKFSERQREIYEIVLAAQRAGFAAVRPGVTIRDVHRAARAVIKEAGYARYFFHGTSHWLGLDVHDVGAMSRTLAPGMVLTVEPGIYLAEENLGVRIEDDVVVTKTGCEVLSDGVPRTVAAIEALMSGRGVGARPAAPLPKRAAPAANKKTRYFHVSPR